MMSSVILQEQENKQHLIFIDSEDQNQLFASVLRLPGQPQHPLCCTMHTVTECPMALVCRRCLISQPSGGTGQLTQAQDVEQSHPQCLGEVLTSVVRFLLGAAILKHQNHRMIES